MSKVALVTGCNGFIGRHLVNRLLDEGWTVSGIDDFSNSVDEGFTNRLYEFFCIDLATANVDYLRDIVSTVDVVFHLAAKARVQASFDDPVKWHDTNVTGTLRLLEACKERKPKFVFTSTSSVYGGQIIPASGFSVFGSHPFPKSPYAIQKWLAEQTSNFYELMFDLPVTILRLFNVYGDNMPLGQYGQAIPTFLHQYKYGLPFTIYGDGETRRDFTFVGDVIDAMLNGIGIHGTFNVGSGENYSVNEICDMIDPLHPKEYLEPRLEPSVTLANIYHTETVFEWSPKVRLPEWINSKKEKNVLLR